MYKRLEFEKQSFSTNIFNFISPSATEVIYINKDYAVEDLYSLYPLDKDLIEIFNNDYNLPIVLLKFKKDQCLLLAKVSFKKNDEINEFIKNNIALPFPVKKRKYKDADLLFYCIADNSFLVCTFFKGVLAVSKDYKSIETVIDSDPENTFFSEIGNSQNKNVMEKLLKKSSISIFKKDSRNILAVNYVNKNDSITFDGYILNNKALTDSIPQDYSFAPYLINLNDSLCLDRYTIYTNQTPVAIKIYINKKF